MSRVISQLFAPIVLIALFFWLRGIAAGLSHSLGLSPATGIVAVQHAADIGLWLSVASLINRLLALLVWDHLSSRSTGRPVPRFLIQCASLAVYLCAVAVIIGVVYDRSLTTLITTSSVLGVLVGFASRSLISDVFSGVAISLDQPFRIGDFIKIEGGSTPDRRIMGLVHEINWRTTRLVTPDDTMLVIPNSMMSESIVVNCSAPEIPSEHEQKLVLDYGIPVDRVLRVLGSALHLAVADGGILASPPSKVRVNKLTENGVEYKITYSVDPRVTSVGKAKHIVLRHLIDTPHQAGLAPAAPRRDLYMTKMPTRHLHYEDVQQRAWLLGRAELFFGLEVPALNHLASQMEVLVIKPGQIVVGEGEDGNSMYVVVEGILEVRAGLDEKTSHVVGQLRPGDFFGEVAALKGGKRTATVAAATEAVVCEIRHEHLMSLLEAYPEVGSILREAMDKRYARTLSALASARAVSSDKVEEVAFSTQIMRNLANYFTRIFGSS